MIQSSDSRKATSWLRRWRYRWVAVYSASIVGVVLLVVLALHERRVAKDVENSSATVSDIGSTDIAQTDIEKTEASDSLALSEPPLLPGALWQPVVPAARDAALLQLQKLPALSAYQDVAGKALVRFVEPQRRLSVGDRVAVTIPQLDETYRPLIERIENGPGSAYSAVGHAADGDGGQHRFVYTAGPHSTFATIGTRQGTFELAASNELGWLMATANMDQHVDYSQPDYYIVRRDGPNRPGSLENEEKKLSP